MTVPQSPQKLFKCPDTHCDYTNVINDYVTTHVKNVHSVQLETEEIEKKSVSENLGIDTPESSKNFKGNYFIEFTKN